LFNVGCKTGLKDFDNSHFSEKFGEIASIVKACRRSDSAGPEVLQVNVRIAIVAFQFLLVRVFQPVDRFGSILPVLPENFQRESVNTRFLTLAWPGHIEHFDSV
jgi:hypothetical protein